MTSTARQLRQPPTIEAIERVPYFADAISLNIPFFTASKAFSIYGLSFLFIGS